MRRATRERHPDWFDYNTGLAKQAKAAKSGKFQRHPDHPQILPVGTTCLTLGCVRKPAYRGLCRRCAKDLFPKLRFKPGGQPKNLSG